MNHFGKRLFALLLALVLTLSAAPLPARAADTVIYDAAEVPRFQRSVSEVAEQYNTALRAGPSYINGSSASYYVRPASKSYPYDQGELKQDTLDAMVAMTNFLRWLEGAEPLQQGAVNNDGLQRGALIRNFNFAHQVSDNKKPADMDKALWDSGKVLHNIIAGGYTPRGSIIGWCNEGYYLPLGSWDTVGHRYSLLQYDVSALEFGYAGSVTIGRVSGRENTVSVPFTAFPAPGPMPVELVFARESAWSLEPNRSLLTVDSADALKVTVTNAATGASYECTKENGKLKYNTWTYEIDFVQPDCGDTSYEIGSVYRVVVSGLTDKATGNPAELRYQVEFADISNSTPQPAYEPVFQDVQDTDEYYYNAVYWACNHKPYQVTAGIDKTHFGPDKTVTRAQAMTFFWAALDRPKFKKANTRFVDVKKTDWFYKSVMWAVENGVTAGTDATHFSPNKTCNRGEILAFLYASLKKPKVKIKNPYKDVTNQWYKKAALWAYSKGIETGENGKFNAATPCTRAAVVTYLYQFETGKSVCKNGHYWNKSKRFASTCTDKGYDEYTCICCGMVEKRNEREALGHNYQFVRTVEPTESAKGYDLYACSRCGAIEKRYAKP